MVKHNNQLVNNHFRKAWDRRVRMWFNQPGRKASRRAARALKRKEAFPRPTTGLLRPVVHCCTKRYGSKQRLGKGFTYDELKAAGLTKLNARSLGVAVDHRRQNQNKETFNLNVERIQAFRSKQVLFPLNTLRKAKKTERKTARDAQKQVVANLRSSVQATESVAFKPSRTVDQARAITEDERKASAFVTLRKAKMAAKKAGDAVKKANAKEKELATANAAKGGKNAAAGED